jgi:DNA-directed RNA polymerase specialized sigma subunit
MKRKKPGMSQYRELLDAKQNIVFTNNIGLAISIARKTVFGDCDTEAVLDAALYGLYKGIDSYSESRGGLISWLNLKIKNEIMSNVCRSDWRKQNIQMEIDADTIADCSTVPEIVHGITRRQTLVMKWRNAGLTFREIGENLGIDRSNAMRIYKKATS